MFLKNTTRHGFTIVELLIVIVVIGILASISIVAYNGIQNRANNAIVKSDLSTIAKQIELYKTGSSSGEYPDMVAAEIDAIGMKATHGSYNTVRDGNFFYCRGPSRNTYAIGAMSKADSGYFLVNGVIKESNDIWKTTTCREAGHPPDVNNVVLVEALPGHTPSLGWRDWAK